MRLFVGGKRQGQDEYCLKFIENNNLGQSVMVEPDMFYKLLTSYFHEDDSRIVINDVNVASNNAINFYNGFCKMYPEKNIVLNKFHIVMEKISHESKFCDEAFLDYTKNFFAKWLDELNNEKNVICVANDISSGIIPLEKSDRFYRDLNGMILGEVAQKSDEVIRFLCGIPQKIKG